MLIPNMTRLAVNKLYVYESESIETYFPKRKFCLGIAKENSKFQAWIQGSFTRAPSLWEGQPYILQFFAENPPCNLENFGSFI